MWIFLKGLWVLWRTKVGHLSSNARLLPVWDRLKLRQCKSAFITVSYSSATSMVGNL